MSDKRAEPFYPTRQQAADAMRVASIWWLRMASTCSDEQDRSVYMGRAQELDTFADNVAGGAE